MQRKQDFPRDVSTVLVTVDNDFAIVGHRQAKARENVVQFIPVAAAGAGFGCRPERDVEFVPDAKVAVGVVDALEGLDRDMRFEAFGPRADEDIHQVIPAFDLDGADQWLRCDGLGFGCGFRIRRRCQRFCDLAGSRRFFRGGRDYFVVQRRTLARHEGKNRYQDQRRTDQNSFLASPKFHAKTSAQTPDTNQMPVNQFLNPPTQAENAARLVSMSTSL